MLKAASDTLGNGGYLSKSSSNKADKSERQYLDQGVQGSNDKMYEKNAHEYEGRDMQEIDEIKDKDKLIES